jgi:hypothetical protein
MIIFLQRELNHDPFDPQRPCEPVQRFHPQPVIVSLDRHRGVRRHLAFAPLAQHPSMSEVDAPGLIERVEAFYDIVGVAGTRYQTFSSGISRTVPPRYEGRHCPHPRVLSGVKRLGPQVQVCNATVGADGETGDRHENVPGWVGRGNKSPTM